MDIGRSFSYITEDQEWWKKVLLGGLISLMPIVGQLYVLGYVLETLKNVIAGREVPLPEIGEDFGGKLVKGLLLWVITFVYFLPLTLLSTCSGVGSSIFTGKTVFSLSSFNWTFLGVNCACGEIKTTSPIKL